MSDPQNRPIEPPPLSGPRPNRVWLYILFAVAIALLVPTFLAGRWLFVSRGSQTAHASTIIASFLADFQPDQPKTGWHYYWNDNGPVGDTNAYAELRWSGKNYVPNDTTSSAGRYVQISNRSGHPGQGPAQNIRDENEHAVIIAFTVAEAGRYVIGNSFISRNDGAAGGSVHLRVFVNNREVAPDYYCGMREKTSFDRELGKLAARDSIYVCIGPGESDYHDSFTIDFSITRL
jgi:hypothetical protein